MANESVQSTPTYQFGDTDLAAERLRRLAAVFNPSSQAVLTSLKLAPRKIADLGCGPGYTSQMLADLFPAAEVLGIDSSEHFVRLAANSAGERVRFAASDVTQALPGGPFDLVYCRYLLTHLADPFAAIDTWCDSLRTGGVLCLEENDWIRTTQPAFARYLEIVAAMLAEEGQRLYVGIELDRRAYGRLRKTFSQVVPVDVTERDAALLFLPNLATWRDRPFIREHYWQAELDQLRDDLQRLVDVDSSAISISFGPRRLTFARN
jgi:SAM-dependent methyltransferase